jgi:hypothetical protein
MRIERKVGAGVAIVGSLLLAVSGAVPALARSGPSAGFSRPADLRFANVANGTSTGFGGWVFQPTVAATSVTAEFKVPTFTCTSTMSGVAPSAVMLTGSSSSPKFNAAGVLLECVSGTPEAAAAVEVDSGTPTLGTNALSVGDLMKSTIVTSASKTTATIADLTTGHTFKVTKSGAGAASVRELIIDDSLVSATNAQLPVANFGKISFSSGAVGGKPLGSVSPKGAGVNMQTSAKVLQILTGALTGTKLNAFLTTWKHS